MTKLVGRKQEQKKLLDIYNANEARFLCVYGRRRVGKTYLIREFFKVRGTYFELTGNNNGTTKDQLVNFTTQLSKTFYKGLELAVPVNWAKALEQLANTVDDLNGDDKVILFFDELPWLASKRSKFIQALEYFWNSWGVTKSNVILVVCGSAASWMINNIINNKGGLHNRITDLVRLIPFNLCEVEEYFQSRKSNLNRAQILELYMCMGGVPLYLQQVDGKRSSTENINRICFTKDGFLYNEFPNLYAALFENSENYVEIIRALAKKRKGLTRKEVINATNFSSGGALTKYLSALQEGGFIEEYVPFGKDKKDLSYRLIDEYSLFYLKWISNAPKAIINKGKSNYWLQQFTRQSWLSWSGFSFESICLKHSEQIKDALGIGGVASIEYIWSYHPKNKNEQGVQIDLLIDRQDSTITICEIKHFSSEFVINKSYAENLQRKIDVFKRESGTKKLVQLVMVTTHGTKENEYYKGLVSQQVTLESLF